jgi:hypothetical protein
MDYLPLPSASVSCSGFRSGSMNAILPIDVLTRRGA